MVFLERMKRINVIIIILLIITGFIHFYFAILFLPDIGSFIESGLDNDINLALAYLFSLVVFALLILLAVIMRSICKDVAEGIGYLNIEISDLKKAMKYVKKQ
jgi:hypothetical protein